MGNEWVKVGMWVTVKQGRKIRDGDGYRYDRSYYGDALEVKAVNKPFICVKCRDCSRTLTLDLREIQLMRISDKYVKAMELNRMGISASKKTKKAKKTKKKSAKKRAPAKKVLAQRKEA